MRRAAERGRCLAEALSITGLEGSRFAGDALWSYQHKLGALRRRDEMRERDRSGWNRGQRPASRQCDDRQQGFGREQTRQVRRCGHTTAESCPGRSESRETKATHTDHEVSKNMHRKANWRAVRFGPICIEPPQRGQHQVATTAGAVAVFRAGAKPNSLRPSASRAVRQGVAR